MFREMAASMFRPLWVLWVGTSGDEAPAKSPFCQEEAIGQQSGPKLGEPVPKVGKPLAWELGVPRPWRTCSCPFGGSHLLNVPLVGWPSENIWVHTCGHGNLRRDPQHRHLITG